MVRSFVSHGVQIIAWVCRYDRENSTGRGNYSVQQSECKLRVFLCHSYNDKLVVRDLYYRLHAKGWIDAWLDSEKLYPGQDWKFE
ncbi:MAG: TIR domain-containing protein [Anaerolineales bacterium]